MELPLTLTSNSETHTPTGYTARLLRDHQYLARAKLDRFPALKHLGFFPPPSKEGLERCRDIADNAGMKAAMLAIEDHEVTIVYHWF